MRNPRIDQRVGSASPGLAEGTQAGRRRGVALIFYDQVMRTSLSAPSRVYLCECRFDLGSVLSVPNLLP